MCGLHLLLSSHLIFPILLSTNKKKIIRATQQIWKMDFIREIVSPVVESLKKHVEFLVRSTEYVEDVNRKMDLLRHIKEDIQETGIESHRKRKWEEDFSNLDERSNAIEASGGFNLAKRYKRGKQSYTVLKDIEDLTNRVSDIEFTNAQKPLAEVGSTSTGAFTSCNFKSRDLVYNNALQALRSNEDSHKMIALCGMGGVGKTTMMEQLKKAVKDAKVFDLVVKVVLGENIDPLALQHAIAQYIGQDLSETAKDARADRLRNIFEVKSQQGKKVLVIMDDLWKEVDLKNVGLSPLPNGFKLLLTSRFANVCTQTGVYSESIFSLQVLNDVEAKDFFFEIVGSDGNDPELQKIGEDIVLKCGGLPIAIKTIAKSLRGNIKEAWEVTLSRLKRDDLKDLQSITSEIFEMSYENLKEDSDKALFLLCGLFPDDFDIHIEVLLRYGWGLNLFIGDKTLVAARRHMKICVNNLIRANLLNKSDLVACVKMHDLVRAFALSRFSNVKQASITNHDSTSELQLMKDANESYNRILLKCTDMSKFPVDFNYPNLSLLIVMDGNSSLKFSADIYERMKQLEVISYEKMVLPLLPRTFEHSAKLRTLYVHSCSLSVDDISSIGSLCNLEMLSLVHCNIRRLPSLIGKLRKLKLLDLTGCIDLHIDDGVFQNLELLEELYMKAHAKRPIKFTHANFDELEKLSQGLSALEMEFFENKPHLKNVSFKTLERFMISIGCQLKGWKYGEKYSYTNTVKFVGNYNELLECKVNDLFDKTAELSLEVNGMNHLKDVSMHHTFSNLRVLYVSQCADLTYLFTVTMANGLLKLERLTISECPMLTSLVGGDNGGGVRFQKLMYMSLKGLPKMVSLCDNVIELLEMVELVVDGLPKFTSIYPESNGDNMFEVQSLLNEKVVIPKLQKLYISSMENLRQIWPCQVSTTEKNSASLLRKITVNNCNSLVNLFPCNPLPWLNHIEELEVKECGSIEVLFNINLESLNETWESSSSRLRGIRVDRLEKLEELWRIEDVGNSDAQINGFKNVEHIEIRHCKGFTNLFTPTTADFDLTSLTNYRTWNCGVHSEEKEVNVTYPSHLLHKWHHLQYLALYNDDLVEEVLFEMDSQSPLLLPCLQHLKLEDLKEMSHVWKFNNWNNFLHQPLHQFPFQNLTNIHLRDCHKIKYLFSPLMAIYLSNLKDVRIESCAGMEEVISSRDDGNTTSTSSHRTTTTFFPHLDKLNIGYLRCLKSIDSSDKLSSNIADTLHDQFQNGQVIDACSSLCYYPRYMYVFKCDALGSLSSWYAVGQMKRLQELHIHECGTMMEVFTFSTLESLNQLKELIVERCEALQVIVKEETVSSKAVVFPCLQKLILYDLPNLKGFFLGMNEFRWPVLDDVRINNCPQLMTYTAGHSKTPKLKYISTDMGKHSLEGDLNFSRTVRQATFPTSSSLDPSISKGMHWSSFDNLIELIMKYGGTSGIPSNALLQLQKLQNITIQCHHGIKEVFEVASVAEDTDDNDFNGSQKAVIIPNLREVKLEMLEALKYLWKSNRWMVLEFPNLTTLSIQGCHNLEHVFTCSMVGSLLQLQDLRIDDCKNIEVILKDDEEECDGKVNEIITLPRLKSLNLSRLPSLKGFCVVEKAFSLPALDTLEIKECPAVTGFTNGHLLTPELKYIETCFGIYNIQGDLNSFINTNTKLLDVFEL